MFSACIDFTLCMRYFFAFLGFAVYIHSVFLLNALPLKWGYTCFTYIGLFPSVIKKITGGFKNDLRKVSVLQKFEKGN